MSDALTVSSTVYKPFREARRRHFLKDKVVDEKDGLAKKTELNWSSKGSKGTSALRQGAGLLTSPSPHMSMSLPQRVSSPLGLCGFHVEDQPPAKLMAIGQAHFPVEDNSEK